MRDCIALSLAACTRAHSTDCGWCDGVQIEKELREQLQLYSSKFKGFQETLVSSNSLFETVKHDLEQVRTLWRLLPNAVWTLAAHSKMCGARADEPSTPQAAEAGCTAPSEGSQE